ncbi:fimbrial protein [Stenotrophomonas maltophilia]|uniref:fimbrial protein n=1 Tax=Stenotrophomonas maltophilia TaxID=40324 RepID=UPI0028B23EF3|nr:fimbrial protein [Stenotrophomonas geniculata]
MLLRAFAFVLCSLVKCQMTASAADGTVNIYGSLTEKTCTVSTPASRNFTVVLPAVSKSALSSVGETAGRTGFTFNLSNCGVERVVVYFEPGPTVDPTGRRLLNQATVDGATNVGLQFFYGDYHGGRTIFYPLDFKEFSVVGQPPGEPPRPPGPAVGLENGAAQLQYFVEYVATGVVTPGAVSSSVRYTIVYF